MVYTRPAHGDPFADASATDATVIIDALSDGLEAAETTISSHTSSIALKANIASPTFTGTAAAPTPAVATDSTTLATTAFVGLRSRVTHPNTTDVLVEVWDVANARWQTTHYDSGWRDISASLTGLASGSCYIRRLNQSVTVSCIGLNKTTGGNLVFYTLPAGFYGENTNTQHILLFTLTPTPYRGYANSSGLGCVFPVATDTYGTFTYALASGNTTPASLPGTNYLTAPAS